MLEKGHVWNKEEKVLEKAGTKEQDLIETVQKSV
jgi:hypothetical protein